MSGSAVRTLTNQVAIVTGAASGIGRAIAQAFAAEGARVIVSDCQAAGAEAVAQGIRTAGGAALAQPADVAREPDVRDLVGRTLEAHGRIDILVNNAGIMDNFVPAAELTEELWERVLAVNLTGPMRAIRQVLPHFVARRHGVILNIASIAGHTGSRAGAAYTASKHALIGLTRNVGFQYAPLGVRCNAIAPGAVDTAIGATLTNPSPFGRERASAGSACNPRTAQPEEIAAAAVFLAGPGASFVTGAVLTADGGWTAY